MKFNRTERKYFSRKSLNGVKILKFFSSSLSQPEKETNKEETRGKQINKWTVKRIDINILEQLH